MLQISSYAHKELWSGITGVKRSRLRCINTSMGLQFNYIVYMKKAPLCQGAACEVRFTCGLLYHEQPRNVSLLAPQTSGNHPTRGHAHVGLHLLQHLLGVRRVCQASFSQSKSKLWTGATHHAWMSTAATPHAQTPQYLEPCVLEQLLVAVASLWEESVVLLESHPGGRHSSTM